MVMIEHRYFDMASALALIAALWLVGLTRVKTSVALYGAQSLILGVLTIALGVARGEPLLVIVGVAVASIKGLAVPAYLSFVVGKLDCRRDDGVGISAPVQFFASLAALALILLMHPATGVLTERSMPAVALLLLGMILMITRRLAVSQIIGFLELENGIFFYTIGQPHTMPIVVEIGVLMDVLSAVMLAGILVFKINRTFEHIDVAELKELKG